MAEFMTMEQAEDKFGKKGVSNTGLGLGIAGTALGLLNGGLGGIFGGIGNGNAAACSGPTAYEVAQKECADNIALTRSIYDTRIVD